MFTEHEVELFALHINFFNLMLLICMQHTDKNVPRKWLCGTVKMYQESGFLVLCTAGSLKLPGA